ncbi:MAG: hypothetical protein H6710_11160 [Myxococcales bacterium]|nr:hypothetical protein [Myxococcales bacterium]MCB9702435.1 hypothetical protein [Myxococcales bacterium]
MVRTRFWLPLALVALSLASPPVHAAPEASEPAESSEAPALEEDEAARLDRAQRSFREGEEAYWLGEFDRAIERFEEAYRLSRLPGMLYNVGLAYKRRGEGSRSPADLQRARDVLSNYLDADAGLLVDPTHVRGLVAEIDASLGEIEGEEREAAATVAAVVEGPADEALSCPDPGPETAAPGGRRQRILGGALMAGGGVLLAGGAASVAAFAAKGREFEATQGRLLAESAAAGCPASTRLCEDLGRSLEITVANGYRANVLAGALGGSLIALGVGGLISGGILYGRASGAPQEGPRMRVAVTPTLGGAAIVGRF